MVVAFVLVGWCCFSLLPLGRCCFSPSFGKVLLSSFHLLFCLALLLPFVLGGSLSPPPSSWVVLPSSSSFWEGAAFSLPLLPGTAASLPPWRLPFSSSLDWCCSGASALDFSFGSVFSNGFFMFVFFLRIIFLLVFPGSAFYYFHFSVFLFFSCFSFFCLF